MKIKHIIVGVHGIRTGAENWSDDYRRAIATLHPDVAVEEYDYGCILGAQMYACGVVPMVGWRRISAFHKWLKTMLKKYPKGATYSIVSHSFGTWLTHGLLNRHKDVKPEAVVIIGSVLSEYFSQTRFPIIFEREQINRLMVLHSKGDTIIKWLSNFPFGKNGINGFIDEIPPMVTQVELRGGHSSYFIKSKRDKTFSLITKFCLNLK